MMRTVKIPMDKLRQWIGEEAEIFDAWMTCEPLTPELVVVVKSEDLPRRRDPADQLRLEAALDKAMMNHA